MTSTDIIIVIVSIIISSILAPKLAPYTTKLVEFIWEKIHRMMCALRNLSNKLCTKWRGQT